LDVQTNGIVFVQLPIEMLKVRETNAFPRKFWFTQDLARIMWATQKRKVNEAYIRVNDIKDVK
jgi:hypothetical protein